MIPIKNSFRIIVERVDGVVFQILQSLVVDHQGFHGFMFAHIQNRRHRRVLLKGSGDRRPPQIVRREFAQTGLLPARFDDMPDVSGRERLARAEVPPHHIGLEDEGISAIGFRVLSIDPVGFQVVVNDGFDIYGQRLTLPASAFRAVINDPVFAFSFDVGDFQMTDFRDAQT